MMQKSFIFYINMVYFQGTVVFVNLIVTRPGSVYLNLRKRILPFEKVYQY